MASIYPPAWECKRSKTSFASPANCAKAFVILRVPSRKRDIIELIPDIDLDASEKEMLIAGSVAAATTTLPPEDFSDWEA